jgi:hypothetical protein
MKPKAKKTEQEDLSRHQRNILRKKVNRTDERETIRQIREAVR